MTAGQLLGLSPDELEALAQPEHISELKLSLICLEQAEIQVCEKLHKAEDRLREIIGIAEQRRCPRQAAE